MSLFLDSDAKRKAVTVRTLPPILDTGWRPPTEFPNLAAATHIAIDVETHEYKDLVKHGPGWAKGQGHIVGIAIAAQCGNDVAGRGQWYFPVRHTVDTHFNIDANNVFGWLKYTLEANPNQWKVGANLLYDLGHLACEGIRPVGPAVDVQFAEPLLGEDEDVNLEYLSQKYLGHGKAATTPLYEWCAMAYGGKPNDRQRANIYRASPQLVAPYALGDVANPLDILPRQWAELERRDLIPVFQMESRLIPLLIDMRMAGARVDLNRAEQMYNRLAVEQQEIMSKLKRMCGFSVNPNSNQQVAKLFDHFNIKYKTTAAGNPSFTKEFLAVQDHDAVDLLEEYRQYDKLRSTFLKGYILDGHVNGKIHCSFHPLRGEDKGTRTGRFSSSHPNLQNIPVRSDVGSELRKAFIPDDGHIEIEKIDYSQIEYRMLAHYAIGPGADDVRHKYNNDPKTDYHKLVQDAVLNLTGKVIERAPIKNMNFGLLYGMSESKLNRQNGFSDEEGKKVFTAYHAGAPYVRATMQAAAKEVQTFGYITTISGRRRYFDLWESAAYRPKGQERERPLPWEQAIHKWGTNIKRANEHKGINSKLQGGAAEIMKRAMVTAYEAGVFNVLGPPRLTVHDELVNSRRDRSPAILEASAELHRIMRTATPLRIPVEIDVKYGPNWGEQWEKTA